MPRIGRERGRPLEYSAGRRTSEQLNQRNIVTRYIVRVTGTLVVTGGTGAGTVREDAPGRILAALRILGSSQTIQSWTGRTLWLVQRLFGAAELPQVLPADDIAGSTEIDIRLAVPMHMLRSLTPNQTAFPTAAVASPRIDTDWAPLTEIFDGGDATGVRLDNPRVEIYEDKLLGLPADARGPGRFERPFVYSMERAVNAAVTGSLFDMDVVVPGSRLRMLIIEAFAGGAGGGGFDPSDDVLTELSLRLNGVEEYSGIPFSEIQAANKAEYGLAAVQTGVGIIDFAEDMYTAGDALPRVEGLQRPQLVYDATPGAGESKFRVTAVTVR